MVTGYSNVLTHLVRAKEHTMNLAHAASRSTHELFGLLSHEKKGGGVIVNFVFRSGEKSA